MSFDKILEALDTLHIELIMQRQRTGKDTTRAEDLAVLLHAALTKLEQEA